jgi:acid phosphatase type 7
LSQYGRKMGLGFFAWVWMIGAVGAADPVVIKPYIQPGPDAVATAKDSVIVSWMADTNAAVSDFRVEYTHEAAANPVSVTPEYHSIRITGTNAHMHYHLYRALLPDLPIDGRVRYKVSLGNQVVREREFSTRRSPGKPFSFVVVGDKGYKDSKGAIPIAYQIHQARADMGVIVGDIVYPNGLLSEYLDHYAGYYVNADDPSPSTGGSPLASTLFLYAVGNHDVRARDLGKFPDGMAAFYLWRSPHSGPKDLPFLPSVQGTPEQVSAFKAWAGDGYPGLSNFSFENGDCHFLVLDANGYVNVMNPDWKAWIEKELSSSKRKWKFVFFHQPGFHTSKVHFNEQRMRVFSPIFEKCGVDVVFSGHVHNYQRSKPLRFKPVEDLSKYAIGLATGKKVAIPGSFTLDEEYDGVEKTSPKGVIYIVTGAGGAKFYDPEYTNKPELWKQEDESWAPFTAKFISDRFSFTRVDVEKDSVVVRQIDADGKEIDRFKVVK